MKYQLLSLAFALTLAACARSAGDKSALSEIQTLSSPDGSLTLTFGLREDGTPVYQLDRCGQPVILPSILGYELRGDQDKSNVEGQKGRIYDDPVSLHDGFSVENVQRDSLDETWAPVWGEEAQIRNHYRELAVSLIQNNGRRDEVSASLSVTDPSYGNAAGPSERKMLIRFRLFDDGLGFRYEFPQQKEMTYFTIKDELTQFAMAGDHDSFWIPGDMDTQEYEFTQSRLSEISSKIDAARLYNASQYAASDLSVQTALQMKTDEGLYINIHEAAVVDYPTTNLDLDEKTLTFSTNLVPDAEGWKGSMMTPCKSPWRTVMVVDDARKVLSSRLILNLNEPCAISDVSWIHPTKYMGVWWEMIIGKSAWSYTNDFPTVQLGVSDYSKATPHGYHGATNGNVRRYIDFAAENGFDGILIEGWNEGWEEWFGHQKDYVFDFTTPYPDFDIAALNDYAHSKGIRLIMHHETSASAWNYERHIDKAFDLMNQYGYDAVKTGYVGDIVPNGYHHYSQLMINHYNYVIQKAIEHKIMVNAHEAVRPTGLCRTYPNMIGNESAMGTEYQQQVTPLHVTILPFTRLQGGPMDYTPGIFEMDLSKSAPYNTSKMLSTIPRQLALYLTMYSPLQMAADLVENYEQHTDAFQFIKDVAVDWDRSEYLLAEPGDYIVVARHPKRSTVDLASKGTAKLPGAKRGYENGATKFLNTDVNGKRTSDKDVWFVGGVTDESARDLTFALDFLTSGKSYEATIYEDAPDADCYDNPMSYNIRKATVDSTTTLTLHVARGGGFAISLKEI